MPLPGFGVFRWVREDLYVSYRTDTQEFMLQRFLLPATACFCLLRSAVHKHLCLSNMKIMILKQRYDLWLYSEFWIRVWPLKGICAKQMCLACLYILSLTSWDTSNTELHTVTFHAGYSGGLLRAFQPASVRAKCIAWHNYVFTVLVKSCVVGWPRGPGLAVVV